MSFCVPGFNFCVKHIEPICVGEMCQKCKKEKEEMCDLRITILKEYSNIRIEKGDNVLELDDVILLLEMLDVSTLGDILANLKAYRKQM